MHQRSYAARHRSAPAGDIAIGPQRGRCATIPGRHTSSFAPAPKETKVLPATAFDEQYAGTLYLKRTSPDVATVAFAPSLLAYQGAIGALRPGESLPLHDVIRIDARAGEIEITPLLVYPPKERFLRPRFDKLRTILFEGYDVRLPRDADDVAAVLDVLPEGFYRRAEYGLGLPKVHLPLIKQIERLPKVTRLVVSKVRPPELDGATLILTHGDVETALAFMRRVADRHQRRSLQERNAHARNHLISPLDPVRFPEEAPPYSEDTVFEALNVVRDAKIKLSPTDETALVAEIRKRVADLKHGAPEALYGLHRKIELVNLEVLIARFKALLAVEQKAEKRWQKLFDLNPFILSMIFGYPIVKVLREASVGAPLLDGRGAKIADFLAKNPATSNAALVELKTPQADLLTAKTYRGDENANPVYPPHSELSGAVAQVLDQRYRLQKDIATHLSNNRGLDLSAYHVDCVVVAGLMPEDEDRKQAFEIYRQSLKDVRVVTFDELLIKLESLHAFLASHPGPRDELDETHDDEAALNPAVVVAAVDARVEGDPSTDGGEDEDDTVADTIGAQLIRALQS